MVRASKGLPGKVLKVYASDWQDILGKPLSKKAGTHMEGLRHLADAVKDCNYVNVVRVVASDAEFPSISMASSDGTATADSHAFGTVLTAGTGVALIVWVVDGDKSANRSVKISNIDSDNERFDITFYDVDENGDTYVLESYESVGIGESDLDDMGLPAFIETVLENNDSRFRCDYNVDDVNWTTFASAAAEDFTTGVDFADGTDGGEPISQDWQDAWDLFRNDNVAADLMFAAGNLDTDVLANCIDIAESRHCYFFFDASPSIKHDAAITWLAGASLTESRQAACYHAPFSANDRFWGGKTVWGVSGEVAAACARGDANMTGAIPGIHYAPAGEKRGKLTRTGITPLYPDDILDRDDLYTARINPVIVSPNGGAVIDDCLAYYKKSNYSRFIWVNRILNYIDHRFLEAAAAAKFEPDGLTEEILYRLTKEILEDLVVSGALVSPRDPDTDGTEPYILTVEQLEIDLWQVTWEVCPTGAARRIAGQPKLIK